MKKPDFASQQILEDFNLFLTFVKNKKELPLTAGKQELKRADLYALNEELHFKAPWVTEKSNQAHYPALHFFYHVALAAGLTQVHHVKKGPVLKINPEQAERYAQFTGTEQYFSLLETTWCYLNWVEFSDMRRMYAYAGFEDTLQQIANQQPGKPLPLNISGMSKNPDFKINVFTLSMNQTLFHAFEFLGFYTLQPDPKLKQKPDPYTMPFASITPTELGVAVIPVLIAERPIEAWSEPLALMEENEEDIMSGFSLLFGLEDKEEEEEDDEDEDEELPLFIDAFKHLAPEGELEQSLEPTETELDAGRLLLKVSLNKNLYRTIAIGASATLEDLHLAIQEAFDFDDDHLYLFSMNNKPYSADSIYTPGCGYPKEADKIPIGALNLYEGQKFVYVFDFGDNWQFDILVKKTDELAPEPKQPEIVESVGEAPEQYPDYDEEGW